MTSRPAYEVLPYIITRTYIRHGLAAFGLAAALGCVSGEQIDPDSVVLSNIGDEPTADAGAEPADNSELGTEQPPEQGDTETGGQDGISSEDASAPGAVDAPQGSAGSDIAADAAPPDAGGSSLVDAGL